MERPMLRKLRRFGAYVLVRTLVGLAELLPRRIGSALFAGLGSLAYYLLPGSRGVALANLRLVYGPEASDRDLKLIARGAFSNLGRFAYDTARLRRESVGSLSGLVTVSGRDHLDRALAGGRGVIGITGHIGNWELLAAYLSMIGYRVHALAARVSNSRLDELLLDLRKSSGVRIYERSSAIRPALRCLRRGEFLGVLIDQDTKVDSVLVDFMGSPAKTAVGPVKLALRTGAPVVPMAMLMTDDGRYEIEISEPIRLGNNGATLEEDVERCSKAIEGFIRRAPSQWVWMHKRWKSVKSDLYA
jgi:KDO2-lipid IV(A) lauroyltransferase